MATIDFIGAYKFYGKYDLIGRFEEYFGTPDEETLSTFINDFIKLYFLDQNFYVYLESILSNHRFTYYLVSNPVQIKKLMILVSDCLRISKEAESFDYLDELADYLISNHRVNLSNNKSNVPSLFSVFSKYNITPEDGLFPPHFYILEGVLDKLTALYPVNGFRLYDEMLDVSEIINTIYEEDFTTECYLFNHTGDDFESYRALVCSNEFLDFIDRRVIGKCTNSRVLANIKSLLNLSISAYEAYANDENFPSDGFKIHKHSLLGKERIKSFGFNRANSLLFSIRNGNKKGRVIYLNEWKNNE